jgi:hypothetical protein
LRESARGGTNAQQAVKQICLSLVFLAILSQSTSYSVIPQVRAENAPQVILGGKNTLSNVAAVLMEAHQLANRYGTRPLWQKTPYSKGEVPPDDQVDDIIAHLMPCENLSRLLRPGTVDKVIDSNNRYSYGLLMFQSSTWQGVEAGAGFIGTPLDASDAIQGARWAIKHGFLSWWSCAKLTHILNN